MSRSLTAVAVYGAIVAASYLKRRRVNSEAAHESESRSNEFISLSLSKKGSVCECYQQLLDKTHLYLLSASASQSILETLLQGADPLVVGFDSEWLSTGALDRIDVLQLSIDNYNFVFQAHGARELPPILRHLLESRRVLKVGVGIAEDARRVKACFGFTVHGCVELNDLYSRIHATQDAPFSSLKTLTQQVCGLDLPKDKALSCSNWNAPELSVEQVIYAASDSYCSLLVFQGLFARYSQLRNKNLVWDYAGVRSLCPGLIDGGRAQVKHRANEEKSSSSNDNNNDNNSIFEQKEDKKTGGAPVRSAPPSTKRLYENCKVFGPDGQLLALTNNKRISRYLKQGAGVLMEVAVGEPAAIKLFEVPETLAVQPESEELQQFYLSNLDNACVVCGAKASFRRFHVIPHAFRRHFPNWYFSHRGHDSLLMCENCHLKAEKQTEKLVKKVFEEHGLDDEQAAHRRRVQRRRIFASNAAANPSEDAAEDDTEQLAAYNSARILLRAGDKMPAAKREECLAVLQKHLYPEGEGEVTKQDIEQAAVQFEQKPRGLATQYSIVVQRLLEDGPANSQLPQFCRRFREYFLEVMKPQHLPAHWATDLPAALEVNRKPKEELPGGLTSGSVEQ